MTENNAYHEANVDVRHAEYVRSETLLDLIESCLNDERDTQRRRTVFILVLVLVLLGLFAAGMVTVFHGSARWMREATLAMVQTQLTARAAAAVDNNVGTARIVRMKQVIDKMSVSLSIVAERLDTQESMLDGLVLAVSNQSLRMAGQSRELERQSQEIERLCGLVQVMTNQMATPSAAAVGPATNKAEAWNCAPFSMEQLDSGKE